MAEAGIARQTETHTYMNTDRQTARQTQTQHHTHGNRQMDGETDLMLAAHLFSLVLITGLEGVPVALAAAAPGIVAQGADEDRLSTQHHSHTLHTRQAPLVL